MLRLKLPTGTPVVTLCLLSWVSMHPMFAQRLVIWPVEIEYLNKGNTEKYCKIGAVPSGCLVGLSTTLNIQLIKYAHVFVIFVFVCAKICYVCDHLLICSLVTFSLWAIFIDRRLFISTNFVQFDFSNNSLMACIISCHSWIRDDDINSSPVYLTQNLPRLLQ